MEDTPVRVNDPWPGDPIKELAGKKVFIQSFGCSFNFADSLRLQEILVQEGSIITSLAEAEAVVVNTCSVVKRTEKEVLRFLSQQKGKTLFVLGCMAAVQRERLLSVCTPRIIPSAVFDDHAPPLGVLVNEAIGLVQLGQGCQGQCTYCITKRARGSPRSNTEKEICRAVTRLCAAGAREIQLTAQDSTSWGADLGCTLPALLHRILSLPGHFRLRMGMMNPATLLPLIEELLPLWCHPKMYPFMHIPIQSGSDPILHAMGRRYTSQECLHLVQTLREQIPELWISTDIIVGFPGETEEDFRRSVLLLEKIRPEKVHITRFSPRPGTPAERLPDTLDRTKKERSRKLTSLTEQMYREQNRSWTGRVVPVVTVEYRKAGSVVCRTPQYRSVVVKRTLPLGIEGMVHISGATAYYLIGEMTELFARESGLAFPEFPPVLPRRGKGKEHPVSDLRTFPP
jgi:tRNA A37 methylthiotransferase MiaB